MIHLKTLILTSRKYRIRQFCPFLELTLLLWKEEVLFFIIVFKRLIRWGAVLEASQPQQLVHSHKFQVLNLRTRKKKAIFLFFVFFF